MQVAPFWEWPHGNCHCALAAARAATIKRYLVRSLPLKTGYSHVVNHLNMA
jgi:hypothetical protein